MATGAPATDALGDETNARGNEAANGAKPVGEPLPVERAFTIETRRTPAGPMRFVLTPADGYYLYRDRIRAATAEGIPVRLDMPSGEPKDDPYFGPMEVFHDRTVASIPAEEVPGRRRGSVIELTYQGCQEGGICYRPQNVSIPVEAPAAKAGWRERATRTLERILPGAR